MAGEPELLHGRLDVAHKVLNLVVGQIYVGHFRFGHFVGQNVLSRLELLDLFPELLDGKILSFDDGLANLINLFTAVNCAFS